jgi:hypothetical protein
MMTIEQAAEVWCPMVRIARRETFTVRTALASDMESVHDEHFIVAGCNRDALGSGNRGPDGAHNALNSCRCIADKCAMWRWEPRTGPSKLSGHPIAPPLPGPRMEPTHGYCGLAGRPINL